MRQVNSNPFQLLIFILNSLSFLAAYERKVTLTSVAVATMKSLFDMCNVTFDGGCTFCRSCWAFFACVNTCTCDRTCLRAWAGFVHRHYLAA